MLVEKRNLIDEILSSSEIISSKLDPKSEDEDFKAFKSSRINSFFPPEPFSEYKQMKSGIQSNNVNKSSCVHPKTKEQCDMRLNLISYIQNINGNTVIKLNIKFYPKSIIESFECLLSIDAFYAIVNLKMILK